MSAQAALDVADVAVGVLLLATSLGRWRTTSGTLLAAGGGTWLLADLLPAATFLHRGVLIQLVLTHPDRRLRGTAARTTVAAGYVYACVPRIAADDQASLVMAAVVLGVAVARFRGASLSVRRSTAVALAAAACLATAFSVGPASRMSGVGSAAGVLAVYDLLVSGVALLIATDLHRPRSARDLLADLVVDLGAVTGPDVLRDRLAVGLGDPDLQIGYWLPEQDRYTDGSGRPLALPPPDGSRIVTPLSVGDERVGILVHDAAVSTDPRLRAQLTAAAQWAVGNLALRARLQAQVARAEDTRRRLVTVADGERARLEARLRQGVERRLARVATLVADPEGGLDGLTSDVRRARLDLLELARGLHARTLADAGLAAALAELAADSPGPVRVEVEPVAVPDEAATTLYFACCEALTNAMKHAHATSVVVRLTAQPEGVQLVVSDDGVGGADTALGTGLLGIADRVEALGGRLAVDSPDGRGTRVEVRLPVHAGTYVPSPRAEQSTEPAAVR